MLQCVRLRLVPPRAQPISPSLLTGAKDLSTPLGVFRGQLLRELKGFCFQVRIRFVSFVVSTRSRMSCVVL